MAKPTIDGPADVVERNVGLTERIMQFLLGNPHVFSSLPDEFELVVLPDGRSGGSPPTPQAAEKGDRHRN